MVADWNLDAVYGETHFGTCYATSIYSTIVELDDLPIRSRRAELSTVQRSRYHAIALEDDNAVREELTENVGLVTPPRVLPNTPLPRFGMDDPCIRTSLWGETSLCEVHPNTQSLGHRGAEPHARCRSTVIV